MECNSEASDWTRGMTASQRASTMEFYSSEVYITKLICLWVQRRTYMESQAGDISRECGRTLWGCTFVGERMQARRCVWWDWVM